VVLPPKTVVHLPGVGIDPLVPQNITFINIKTLSFLFRKIKVFLIDYLGKSTYYLFINIYLLFYKFNVLKKFKLI